VLIVADPYFDARRERTRRKPLGNRLATRQGAHPGDPESFIERWVIPDSRAADPTPPSEAQTPTIPSITEDQPGGRVIIPPMTKQESESEARGVVGKTSYYAYSRGKTSSGAPNNPNGLTAAHRTLPFGTRLRVTDIETRKSVIVVVNDRGPAIRTREIDLTRRAAQVLQMISRGVAQVRIEAITATN